MSHLLVALFPLVAASACSPVAAEATSHADYRQSVAGPMATDAAAPEEEPARSEIPEPPRPATTVVSSLPRFSTVICPADAVYEPLVGLHFFTAPPDYSRLNYGSHAEAGWRCAHSTHPEACAEDLRSRSFPRSLPPSDSLAPHFFVSQTGDQIETIATWSLLARLLGPVDTLHEAALYATLRRYRIECGLSTGERAGDGWQLTAVSGGGCGPGEPVVGHVLQIDAAGKLVVLASMAVRVQHCVWKQ